MKYEIHSQTGCQQLSQDEFEKMFGPVDKIIWRRQMSEVPTVGNMLTFLIRLAVVLAILGGSVIAVGLIGISVKNKIEEPERRMDQWRAWRQTAWDQWRVQHGGKAGMLPPDSEENKWFPPEDTQIPPPNR